MNTFIIYCLMLSREPNRRGLFCFLLFDPAWMCFSDLKWFNVKHPNKPIHTGSNNFSPTQTNQTHKKRKQRKKETALTWQLLCVNGFVTQSEGKGEKKRKRKGTEKCEIFDASYLTEKKKNYGFSEQQRGVFHVLILVANLSKESENTCRQRLLRDFGVPQSTLYEFLFSHKPCTVNSRGIGSLHLFIPVLQ